MIVDQGVMASHLDRAYDADIGRIHEALEGWIKTTTGHDWESTSYVEFVNGTGTSKIYLEHYPVSAISRIAALEAAIKIRNTDTGATNAYATVDSDSLDLTHIDETASTTSSLAFATYATLTTLIAAINALSAYSWDAAIYDSDYASVKSSNLMPVENFYCGSWNGTTASYYYLNMLGQPLSGLMLDGDIGEVYCPGGFSKGHQNYVAKYTAYTTVPAAITGAVLNGVKFLVTQHEYDTEGLKNFSTADLSASFEDILPSFVLDVVHLHSKVT